MVRIARVRGSKGAMLVEAAILLPLLLLLTFGVIEYGWAFLKSQQITNAARQSARIAARPDATNAEVQATASALMDAAGISGYQVTLPADITQIPPGNPLTVKITVPYSDIELAGPPFVPMPTHLEASVTMAKEGP